MTQIKPLASQTNPRYSDIATFFRLPVIKDLEKLDYCICGIPWDGGTTNRPGARHGPREIRNASSLVRTYHPSSLKSPYDKFQIADIGDCPTNPIDVQDSLKKVTNFPILKNLRFFNSKFGKIIAILITQYFIFLAWIPFRVHDFNAMIYSMNKFIFLDLQIENVIPFISANKFEFILIFGFLLLHWYSYRKTNLIEVISKLSIKKWGIFLLIVVILIVFFYNGNPEDFVYFKF